MAVAAWPGGHFTPSLKYATAFARFPGFCVFTVTGVRNFLAGAGGGSGDETGGAVMDGVGLRTTGFGATISVGGAAGFGTGATSAAGVGASDSWGLAGFVGNSVACADGFAATANS